MKRQFADVLASLMKKNDLQQVDLVRATGISKGAISAYLSGEYVPKQNNTYKLAQALGVSEAELMGWTDKGSSRPIDQPLPRSIQRTITTMSTLNKAGQEKVLSYAVDLHASGKYDREPKIMPLSPQEVSASNAQIAAHSGEELDDEQRAEILRARDEFQKKQEENNK